MGAKVKDTLNACIWRCAAAVACGLGVACARFAAAQGIDIRTPQLPPRGAGAQAGAVQQPPAPAHPGYASSPANGQQPGHGPPAQSPYGSGTHSSFGGQGAGASVASPLQQRRGGYGQQPGYTTSAQPPAAMTAKPSAAGGHCRAQPSPDRQTLSLVGPDGLPRRHVPLGAFRVQRVVHSDDGTWAVALTKLRGEERFAAMTLDLARCETANTVDLPATGGDIRFESDAVVVRLVQGERRVPLRSELVQ